MVVPPPMLEGGLKNTAPLRLCNKCGKEQERAGGISVSSSKWICRHCWYNRVARRK